MKPAGNGSTVIGRLQRLLGIDKAIFFTALTRGVQAIGGVATVSLILAFLTKEEQGYYYTFGSILALQIFFELGFTAIITQYVAHEMAYLSWGEDGRPGGDARHLSRLSSLLRFSVKWYLIISAALLLILVVSGGFFFRRFGVLDYTAWFLPWVILSVATSCLLFINPLLAFLEGMGKVKEVAKIRLAQQLSNMFLVWIVLLLHGKLYAGGVGSLVSFLFLAGCLCFGKFKILLVAIWNAKGPDVVNYKQEIFPYQFRMALSWMASYFIFQLFNPVLFAYEGPVVAGQMGLTLSVLNNVLALSISWISTKVPLWSGFIARKEYTELDNSFGKTLKQSSFINFAGLLTLFLLVFALRFMHLKVADRILPYFPLAMLMISVFFNNLINGWATYLRCHKKEPFLFQSIVVGILCGLSTLLLGKYFGVKGITAGYCFITVFVSAVWALNLFVKNKKLWHEV
ncbi:lipopolysaccharide biosynthesis protein [Chitinophaga tropicalis]|uniref:O-antigen/teichoic acid export membrane protein n=1 Tax=Chitinophaga tropicalis TaxID=2683588 RepID=A0A7K1TZ93_9BACT|nr:hypothetical protein [Chitinophaga tropicalis]MVT07439.1 hypothetical protein [Chitinophaga tropicalis]